MPEPTQPAVHPIVASKLSKRYREVLAVDGVDIDLPAGIVAGFVGPNGAGKTTTIQLLLGLAHPTGGSARVLGEPIEHPERYLRRVGALIESPAFYPALSGQRNLEVLVRLGRLDAHRIPEVLELVGLTGRAGDRVKTYSLGMKQRLGVAAALLPDPDLVILDEPTNGLDPSGIREMRSVMRGLADRGITVLVSSHLLAEIEAICDHLMMIDHGRIVFQGAIAGLLDAQHAGIVARPEHDSDLEQLMKLAASAGKPARIEDGALYVTADEDWAAELNRQAFAAGITLRALEVTRASLEDAFFAITEGEEQPAEEVPA
ncbi:MAG: ATP-binding cassette domain-containing protein [Solirubrobacteraceae bacterium]|jgi:ABC-2 type transport system ATP-binding protein